MTAGAGRKAWETRRRNDAAHVQELYRATFGSRSKAVARERMVAALKAAGVTTVLDLWGGGESASLLVQAGFRVISCENGDFKPEVDGQPVTLTKRKAALTYAAAEGGYEARWGPARLFAHEADGAFLDFCGPWTVETKRTVAACRHMKAVVVTLTPDHDIKSDATDRLERQMAYQLFLKMAWSERPVWEVMQARGGVRRLLDYTRERGYAVFLYLLSRKPIQIPAVRFSDRERTRPDMHRHHLQVKRTWYNSLTMERRRQTQGLSKHRAHLRGATPRVPCELCEKEGRLGAANPA